MKYISHTESYLLNGNRHKERGDYHLRMGFPEYALGSYKKAIKNWNRYISLTENQQKLENNLFYKIMQPMMNDLAKSIADSVMYGTGYSLFTNDGDKQPIGSILKIRLPSNYK